MSQSIKIILVSIISGAISGAFFTFIVLNSQSSEYSNRVKKEDVMKQYYVTENAIHVSPHGLRKAMDKGDQSFILVDLRSQEEYEEEHIIGAVNIPAYRDKDNPDYGAVERIVDSFKTLKSNYPNRDIIVHCYSFACGTGKKIGKMLAEHGIYVKHLGIGWNEWRYFWTLWNHEHEWNETDVYEYIVSGEDPGIPNVKTNATVCPIDNQFGC